MCSFLFTSMNVSADALKHANAVMQRRGPDSTNVVVFSSLCWVPVRAQSTADHWTVDLKKIAAFNRHTIWDIGVSLNKTYDSDAASVTGAYQLHGQRFATHLDGEFAIVLLDSKNNKTDAFGIKPVWVATENGHFAAASYASALLRLGFKKLLELPPNTAYVFDANSFIKLDEYKVHTFDLRQFKTDFADWNSAFERAVAKRMRGQHNVALALSGGHDSGAIACATINQNISNYILVSVEGVEKSDVVEDRFRKCQPNCQSHLLQMRQQHLGNYREHLHQNAEDYAYIGHTAPCRLNYETPTSKTSMIYSDVAASAMAYISSEIRKLHVKILISGTGADETISDYAFNGTVFHSASTFKEYSKRI